jgi:3-oxoacyl-[acyl-carrier protein] reductase
MYPTGKRVIVTGGVRGLGRCTVDQLVGLKADVTVFDFDAAGFEDLRSSHPEVTCIECDVSDYAQVTTATNLYHDQFGCADILINNAGIIYSAPLVTISAPGVEKHSVMMWDKVLRTDLSSVFYMTSCVVAGMLTARKKGVIVNISSVSAAGNAGQSAYSAAKAGVNALTAVWAKELAPLGIRVVGVAPGFTATESTKSALTEATLRDTVRRTPLRRLGQPAEIAAGILAVIQNDFFNGRVFELDGGLIV